MGSHSDSLNELLIDMGRYLTETLVSEKLSSDAEIQRVGLLQRLEPHIQQTGAEISSAPITPPPYLDMNGPKVAREEYVDADRNGERVEEEYEEFPELVPPPIPAKVSIDSSASSSTSSAQSEDYVNLALPYSELRTMTNKCGPLWRKEKFIFLDQWRQCWAGIYGHVVLLYNSERDVKPVASFDVQGFDARPLVTNNQKDPKKKDAIFEIVCPGKKTHQFIARTAKDMSQWVIAICMASSQITVPRHGSDRTSYIGRRKLPSLPDSDSEMYDDVGLTAKKSDMQQNYEPVQSDEEEIYHDIADVYQRGSQTQSNKFKVNGTEGEPPIPPRRPVPSDPNEEPTEEEEVYDDVGVASDSNMYYNMVGVGAEEKQQDMQSETKETATINIDEIEEDIYDDVGVTEQPSKTTGLSLFRRDSSGNGGRIQHIIKKMEASIGNGNKITGGHRSKPEKVKQRESEELYEPIENGEAPKSPLVPDLPPRSVVR